MSITTIQFTLRLLAALLLGAAIGLERQWRQRMAGTRTNALVAAGYPRPDGIRHSGFPV